VYTQIMLSRGRQPNSPRGDGHCGIHPVNRIEEGRGHTGFVTSGIAYQYVEEAFPEAPVLKLGTS